VSTQNADFIAKLREIEEQANCAYAELGPGLCGTRLQHIVVLAMTLRGRLEFGAAVVGRKEMPAASGMPREIGRCATAEA
jgi:hypothetical protein